MFSAQFNQCFCYSASSAFWVLFRSFPAGYALVELREDVIPTDVSIEHVSRCAILAAASLNLMFRVCFCRFVLPDDTAMPQKIRIYVSAPIVSNCRSAFASCWQGFDQRTLDETRKQDARTPPKVCHLAMLVFALVAEFSPSGC